jgi:hypothetical protein
MDLNFGQTDPAVKRIVDVDMLGRRGDATRHHDRES